jgi:general stress protein 26
MSLTKPKCDVLWQHLKKIDTLMLITHDGELLRARPMQLIQDDFDGNILFYSEKDGDKHDEILANPNVCVCGSNHSENTFISISGKATFVADSKYIDKYWTPFVSAWFPEGKEQAAIIDIDCQRAELWDSTRSEVKVLLETIVANLTHSKPRLGENLKFGEEFNDN